MCVPGSRSSRVVERASGACDRNVADPTTTTHLTGEAEQWPSRSVGSWVAGSTEGCENLLGETKLAVAELVNLTCWVRKSFTSF